MGKGRRERWTRQLHSFTTWVCALRWSRWPGAQQPQKRSFCFTVVEGIPSLLTPSTFPPYHPFMWYTVAGTTLAEQVPQKKNQKSFFWDSATSPALSLPHAHQFGVLWEGNMASWEHNMSCRIVGHALSSSQSMGQRCLTHPPALKVPGQASLPKSPQPLVVKNLCQEKLMFFLLIISYTNP